MAENRSSNPPRRSGRTNIGEPAQKQGSWCSGAELDGEVEQKSQVSTSRSSQSARVAARKLREAKLHAEEAKALLEKEKSRKTTGNSIRLEGPLCYFRMHNAGLQACTCCRQGLVFGKMLSFMFNNQTV